MRKIIPVIAALLCAAGLYLYSQLDDEAGISHEKLVEPEAMPSFQIDALKEGLSPGKYIDAYVKDVVDGDTIEVTYDKKEYKVRLLCIDTPESVKPGIDVQPYAVKASKLVKRLVDHKQVRLVFEKGLRDKYGRILAYVLLEDGTNINSLLIRNGYARVETVPPNTKNKAYFLKLQNEAIKDEAGLWGLDADKQPFIQNNKGKYIPRYYK